MGFKLLHKMFSSPEVIMVRQDLTPQGENLSMPIYEFGDCAGEHAREREKRSLWEGKVFFKT